MRYSTQPKFRKYVKGYSFLSFARTFGDKYGKKLMDTVTKTGVNATKTLPKRVVQKYAEAAGDFNYFNRQTKKKGKNKQSRRTLHSIRKKTRNY